MKEKSWLIGKSIVLGEEWYLEKYNILSQAKDNSFVIDVGCHRGQWMQNIKPIIPSNVKCLGIDPIYYDEINNVFDYNEQCAIDNVEKEASLIFNLFDEPGCNSLLNKSEYLVSRNVVDTITVKVKTLESLMVKYGNSNTNIHYLKCDCQGKDIDVVKSLRSFLPQTNYVQIECSFDKNKPLYTGQSYYEDDIETMDKLGFESIFYMKYSMSPLPEGEILFKKV